MKNPITELTGPEFLVFYAIVIAVTVAFCWWRRICDTTVSLPPLSLPDRVDPYEIAFLRGGGNEVARVSIVRLMQLRYLRIENKKEYKWGRWYETSEKQIVQKSDHSRLGELTAL